MRLSVLKPFLLAKSNGGEISLIERLGLLQQQGAEIEVFCALADFVKPHCKEILERIGVQFKKDHYEIDGIKVRTIFSSDFHPHEMRAQAAVENAFANYLNEKQPNRVWAHYTDFFAVTSAMKWAPENSWVMMTDNEYPRLSALKPFPSIHTKYLFIQNFIVASQFMKQSVHENFPNSHVQIIPNPVKTEIYESLQNNVQNYWLFVNPTQVKGLEFMLQLCSALPNEKFLFVGNWAGEKPETLPSNVTYWPPKKDLSDAFEKSKGLLMPSVWEEAFGRLAIEAMAARIPVIASNRGGLPETVGSGGHSLPLNLPQWIDLVQKPRSYWEPWILRGVKRVEEYHAWVKSRFADTI